jgi:hypothetical protein
MISLWRGDRGNISPHRAAGAGATGGENKEGCLIFANERLVRLSRLHEELEER